jgi:carbonic anhydrase
MSHVCDACVVTCEDFRLHLRKDWGNLVGDFIRDLKIDCDLITRAGAVQDLVRPKPGADESLLRDIGVSVNLHKAGTIYLVNHTDCGAYGGFEFESPEKEVAQHVADLHAARDILTKKFPGVHVEMRLAELQPGTADAFQIRPVA